MDKRYRDLKEYMLGRWPVCEVCMVRPSVEVNHCLYHKHGGIYDGPENCQMVCPECRETQKDNAIHNRDNHWKKRIAEGYDMEAWNNLVPVSRRKRYGI